jgi:hypothetical protein
VTAGERTAGAIAHLVLLALLAGGAPGAAWGEDTTFLLRIESPARTGEPKILRATIGDRVRLEIDADRPVVVHVHGLGVELVASPGNRAEASLEARATGRFPVHVHDARDPAAVRGHAHRAPFAYLEVHPK